MLCATGMGPHKTFVDNTHDGTRFQQEHARRKRTAKDVQQNTPMSVHGLLEAFLPETPATLSSHGHLVVRV